MQRAGAIKSKTATTGSVGHCLIERSLIRASNDEGASAPLALDSVADDKPAEKGWQRPLGWLRRAGQFFFALSFSSLTRRIVSLNLAGLVALVASILYLSQFRAGLIEARAQSLLVMPRSSRRRSRRRPPSKANAITIDADRLLDLKPGESYGVPDEYSDFPINPERVAPVLRRLISPTKTRARIFDRDGGLILDSRNLFAAATCCASSCRRRPPTSPTYSSGR